MICHAITSQCTELRIEYFIRENRDVSAAAQMRGDDYPVSTGKVQDAEADGELAP
jgi:hypothetical protein